MDKLSKFSFLSTTSGCSGSSAEHVRPWGSFYYLHPSDTKKFVDTFFSEYTITNYNNISPKILVVNPTGKLSWQYHNRRKEIWKVISGPVQVITSHTDDETEPITLQSSESIIIDTCERHRLVGLPNFGKSIIAELWIHTDDDNPSDENDIVRLSDIYSRS